MTIDKDNAVRLERLRKQRHASLKEIVNAAIRNGLDRIETPPKKRAPLRTRVFDGGGFVDPSRSVKEMLRDMNDEYDRKKLGLPRASD